MKGIEDLIPILIKSTEGGKLSWGRDGNIFSAKLPKKGFSVNVWEWTDPDTGVDGVSASLKSGNEVVDKIIADEYDPSNARVSKLLSVAMRSAHNVDAIIDEIEDLLDGE